MPVLTPRECLTLFTAGWLGGGGALSVLNSGEGLGARILGACAVLAAAGWFAPRFRLPAMGAMLGVLAAEAVFLLVLGRAPGAVIFYAAVCVYLAHAEARGAGDSAPTPDRPIADDAPPSDS